MTYFDSNLHDKIEVVAGNTVNAGETQTRGVEVEGRLDYGDKLSLTANYTYTEVYNQDNDDIWGVAKDRVGVSGSWAISSRINLNLNANWQSHAPRAPGDARGSMQGYLVANSTVSVLDVLPGLDLDLTAHNFLNTDYSYPATRGANVPGDYPAGGQSFLIKARYRF